jgi:large subunit ribosomal protein L1
MAKKPTAEAGAQQPDLPAPGATTAPQAGESKKRTPKKQADAQAGPSAAAPAAAPAAAKPAAPAPGEPTKKKGKAPGVPPKRGKKLRAHLKNVENQLARLGTTTVPQAISFLKANKRARFDETVEVHMCLGIDTKQSDQLVRGAVALPHGLGKSKRVIVFAQGDNATKAKEAGADVVGAAELAEKIQKENWLDFDVALTTPDMMGIVGRLGKVLGPRSLMPTPKAGTVVTGDIAGAVKEFKAGKVEFRADATGNIHAPVGKMSFDEKKLTDNIQTLVDAVKAARPAAAKGVYLKSVTVSATMSPGVRVSV